MFRDERLKPDRFDADLAILVKRELLELSMEECFRIREVMDLIFLQCHMCEEILRKYDR